jgi:CRP-like cAMP-binding protein
VGDVVGETAYLQQSLRTATVSSLTPVRALRIQYDVLDRLLVARPRMRAALANLALSRSQPIAGTVSAPAMP